MKKLVSILLSVMVLVGIMVLAGCEEQTETYTVTFMNGDEVFRTVEVSSGSVVETSLKRNPTKDAENGYEYTFTGWKNGEESWDFDTMTVTGDLTLVADYSATMIDYTVTIKYYDKDLIKNYQTEETVVFNVGNMEDKLSEIKEKLPESTAQYSYAWKEALPETLPLENQTFVINRTTKTYTVKFINDGEEFLTTQVAYGSVAKYRGKGNPSKDAENGYEYTFNGWKNGEEFWNIDTMPVTGDLTLVADYSATMLDYKVTVKYYDTDSFMNYQTKETIVFNVGNRADKLSEIKGKLPESTVQYSYAWEEALPTTLELEDKTFVVNRTTKTYTVKFMNGGTELKSINVTYGSVASYSGKANPTKSDENGYRYTFAGWKNGDEAWNLKSMAVTGDLTLVAEFSATMIDYTAKVRYYDLDSKEDYKAEETVEFNVGNRADKLSEIKGKLPESTTKYSYGWGEALPTTLALEDKTFVVNRTTKAYTVKFMNGDTELQSSKVAYCSVASYNGEENPTKEAEEGYKYVFNGWKNGEEFWNLDSMLVTGDLVLTADFTLTAIKYTATIEYYDSDLKENYQSEETVIFNIENKADKLSEIIGKLPDSTTQYSYEWKESLPETLSLNNTTFVVVRTMNGYVVKFMDGDTELQSTKVFYGSLASYNGESNPEKEDENGYRYTFTGWKNGDEAWDLATMTVTGDLTLKADYSSEMVTYTATVKYYDTDLKEDYQSEETIEFNVDNMADKLSEISGKLLESTAQYTYAWEEDLPITLPFENKTFVANRTTNVYTVKFMSGDTELQSTKVAYGSLASYNGEGNPEKEDENGYRYTFTGWKNGDEAWDFATNTVTEDLTLKADYSSEMVTYTATIKYNDTDSKENYQLEETIEFNVDNMADKLSEIAGKLLESTAQYTYAWEEDLPETLPFENKTFVANRTTNVYTVTFNTNGGSNIESQNIKYGETAVQPSDPTKDADETYSYEFYKWSLDGEEFDFSTKITDSITLIAAYKQTYVSGKFEADKGNFESSDLEKSASVKYVQDAGKYLSIDLNNISGVTGKMSIVTNVLYTNITKVTFKVIVDTTKEDGGNAWWGINYFTDYSTTDIYTNMNVSYSSYSDWTTVEFNFDEPVSGHIGIIGAVGEFVNPVILIDDFKIYCDEGVIVDNFDNSDLMTEGEFLKDPSNEYINIVKLPSILGLTNPNGDALAIDLKTAVSNNGNAIAFSTTEKHIYKEVSFDLYMPALESKTGWIGGFAFKETIGDNYTCVWELASGYVKGAWNKIDFRVSGTTATYYVNGKKISEVTISEDATYFYIWLNPGDGDFTDQDILLIDNLSIIDDTKTVFEDFDNNETQLLTASHNLLKEFSYVPSTLTRVDSLTFVDETLASESVRILSTRKYSNVSSIEFDFLVNTGFTQTWGGIELNNAPTDIYNHQTKVEFMTGLTKDKTYHIVVTIDGNKMRLTATCPGEDTKMWLTTVQSNEGVYVVFFQESKPTSAGYVISNYSITADGITYTGLENLTYPDGTTSKTNDSYLADVIASGKIESYLSLGHTSIAAKEMPKDVKATKGLVKYTLSGTKEFAIKVGMVEEKSAYIVVDGNNVLVYVGSTLKKTLSLTSEITYEITEDGTLYVNGTIVDVTITAKIAMKIVGFGGTGSVTFDDISVLNTITDKTIKTHTVTFDTNGGSFIKTQVVKKGETAVQPSDPTKEATDTYTYEFYRWTLNGEEYDFSTKITEDIVLVAEYKQTYVSAKYEADKDNFESSNLEKSGVAEVVDDQGKYLSIDLNNISGATGKMSIVTKNQYTNITKVTFKVIMDASNKTGGNSWWGINYFTDISSTNIYTNMRTTTSSYSDWTTVVFDFGTPVTGYIGIIGAKGEFVNPVILIDDFKIYCDEGIIVDNFDNSDLTETGKGEFVKDSGNEYITTKKSPSILGFTNPNGNALAINLKTAVSNNGNAIAFATTEKHIYKEISFDLYMPAFESKTGWIGGFAFKETIGDNYSYIEGLMSGYVKGAWNKIDFRVSGTTATYYVNGKKISEVTIPENATYFYICINPGDGTFTDQDILLIDNLSITDDTKTVFEDFDNNETLLLTASHNLVKEFSYVLSTLTRVDSLTFVDEALASESIRILSTRKYSNVSRIEFDFLVNTGFTQTWGGIELNNAPTDIYHQQSSIGFMAGLTKDKTYHIVVTIDGNQMKLTATCQGEETKTWEATVQSNEEVYVVFFQESKPTSAGYVISNYSVTADGITYTGLENLTYPDGTASKTNDSCFADVLSAGKIESYLALGHTSIAAKEDAKDVKATKGSVKYTLSGTKEFAIKVGMVEDESAYIVVNGSNVLVYVGSTLKKTLSLTSEVTYEITDDGTLYVNDTNADVTITAKTAMKIVGFGGTGSVTFDAISVSNTVIG